MSNIVIHNNKNQNLLNQIEKISSEAAKSKLDFTKLSDINDDILSVSEFLDISFEQTILFACLLELSLQRTVTLDNLARHLKCSILKIINCIQEIDVLVHKRYIQKSNKSHSKKYSYNDLGFSVPHHVIESLRTAERSKLKENQRFSLPNFLERIAGLISEREENESSTQDLVDQVNFMIANHRNQVFIKYIDDNARTTINKCVAFSLAYSRMKRFYSVDIEALVDSIFDDFTEQMGYLQQLTAMNNELFKKDIVRFQESSFMNEKVIGLTSRAVEILYRQYPELYFQEENDGIIKAVTINKKRLYFDDALMTQVESLTNILGNKNFVEFQSRLQSNNLPKGITAIFFGQSGTGKTETAFQIARKTGRDIMMVELSQVKSKWFGESEKQVKKIFDDYRKVCNNNRVKPILFINEADGMFSKRLGITNKNTSVDQTVNTIQNIILQELENFEGILFATTNLTENLDSAFERRFLFKVEFKNPLPEVCQKIWKSKLPELTPKYLKSLSSRYQLSGGEIENVARKYLVEKVIDGKDLSLDRLIEFCEQEKPFQRQNKIGFRKT